MNKELILIRGLPGSGKSTLAKRIKEGYQYAFVYEADDYFYDETGKYNYDFKHIKTAHEKCQQNTLERLAFLIEYDLNGAVIVSNTFTTKKELAPYFNIAKDLAIIPKVILCQNSYGSIHGVPEETMIKMRNRFEYDITELFNG